MLQDPEIHGLCHILHCAEDKIKSLNQSNPGGEDILQRFSDALSNQTQLPKSTGSVLARGEGYKAALDTFNIPVPEFHLYLHFLTTGTKNPGPEPLPQIFLLCYSTSVRP